MRRGSIYFSVIFCLLYAISARAASPSFDCNKASAPDELAICADDGLARLDREAAAAWRKLRATDKTAATRIGRELQSQRRACGSDKTCIRKAQTWAIDEYASSDSHSTHENDPGNGASTATSTATSHSIILRCRYKRPEEIYPNHRSLPDAGGWYENGDSYSACLFGWARQPVGWSREPVVANSCGAFVSKEEVIDTTKFEKGEIAFTYKYDDYTPSFDNTRVDYMIIDRRNGTLARRLYWEKGPKKVLFIYGECEKMEFKQKF